MKVLSSYLEKDGITPAGSHAANQILLRIKFLHFSGSAKDLVSNSMMDSFLHCYFWAPMFVSFSSNLQIQIPALCFNNDQAYPGKPFPSKSDFDFGDNILSAAKAVLAEREVDGVKPKGDIFDRAIIRLRIPADGSRKGVDPKTYSSRKSFELLLWGINLEVSDLALTFSFIVIFPFLRSIDRDRRTFFWKCKNTAFRNYWWYCHCQHYCWLCGRFLWPSLRLLLEVGGLGRQWLVATGWHRGGLNNKAINGSDNSTDRTERSNPYAPPPRGIFGMLKGQNKVDEDEPFTIFEFKCGAPMCGK